MQVQRVSESAWYVQGLAALGSGANQNFISNASFVITTAGVVVIDALGSPVLAKRLLGEIRKITPLPVKFVLVTHYHADHVYGLQIFKAAGAYIIAQRLGREYLFSDTARLRMEASRQDLAPWIDANTHLVPADQWIDGPTTLNLGGTVLQLIPVGPAHTPEDMAIYFPKEGVLFSGDVVFRGRVPYIGEADSGHWIKALDTLLALKPHTIVPGHGPYSTDAVHDISLTRDYLKYLRQTMGRAAQEMEPFDEAYDHTDWSAYKDMPLFRVANRMNAYNTYLLMEHQSP